MSLQNSQISQLISPDWKVTSGEAPLEYKALVHLLPPKVCNNKGINLILNGYTLSGVFFMFQAIIIMTTDVIPEDKKGGVLNDFGKSTCKEIFVWFIGPFSPIIIPARLSS